MSSNSQQSAESTGCKELPRFTDWSQWKPQVTSSVTSVGDRISNPIDKPDTNNATKLFNLGDLQKSGISEEKWRKLDKYNSGLSNRKWTNSPYTTYLLNRHHIMALSSQLDLTQRQRKEVYHRFMGLRPEEWGVSANLLAFCVCAVTVHEDDTIRSYHYNQNDDNKDGKFVQITESLGLRQKSIRKFYSKYRRYLAKEPTPNTDYKNHEKRRWDKNRRITLRPLMLKDERGI